MYSDYIDHIIEDDQEQLNYQAELEHVNKQLSNLETYPELPEDFDLHSEFYLGEFVDHRTRT